MEAYLTAVALSTQQAIYKQFSHFEAGLIVAMLSEKKVRPFDLPWDRNNFAPEVLRGHLLIMTRMILNNEGQVFYNNGTDQSPEKHFSTIRPTYINLRKKYIILSQLVVQLILMIILKVGSCVAFKPKLG
jgi:hypothetical protein